VKQEETLQIQAQGERELVILRSFNAPRALVFQAFTTPALLGRWLLGPPGWSMPVCEVDLRVGGSYRYVWRNEDGRDMGMGGVFREIIPAQRLVCTEVFDEAWYPGEGLSTLEFVQRDAFTLLTNTVRYESREARDIVLQSPMEQGLVISYNRLGELLAAQARH
jgi:uncharacterized protein YndB with AHSA1/START domain